MRLPLQPSREMIERRRKYVRLERRRKSVTQLLVPASFNLPLTFRNEEKVLMTDRLNDHNDLLKLTSEIVGAHVSNNPVPLNELTGLIQTVYSTLTGLSKPAAEPEPELRPAINPKKSVTDEYIVCLEDGKKLKMLKRHLATAYDMTPEQYRAKWGLPYDYPMVAPAYAKKRQELAKKIGLGRKPRIAEAEPAPKPKGRRSRPKAAA